MDKPIKTYSLEGLAELATTLNQPKFRGMQIAEWLYAHEASSFDDMTNLPKTLRTALAEEHPLHTAKILDKQISQDETRKYVVGFEDGQCAEMVAIPSLHTEEQEPSRLTVCISTQVGCSMGCTFCATGQEGFTRNLQVGEIVDQVILAQNDFGTRVSNVVVMGQGEPFLNYENTLAALRILNHQKLMKIGARKITVSTCGIVKGIDGFAQEPEQFTLAVSLHSAIQSTRNVLMPNTQNQPLRILKAALSHYIEQTGRRVTLEHVLIEDMNDGEEDLDALVKFCDGLLCHVNLLPLNPIDSACFTPSKQKTVQKWLDTLDKKHIEATFRQSRGSDIAGACGQLKNKLA